MLEKRAQITQKYMQDIEQPSLDATLLNEQGFDQTLPQNFQNFKLDDKEKNLYQLMQNYMQTQKVVEQLHPQQKSGVYMILANVYAGIASMLDKKNNSKEESSLFKVLAMTYAQNAFGYQNNAKLQNPENSINYH